MNRFIFSQHKSTGEVFFNAYFDIMYVLDAEGLQIPAFVLNGTPYVKVKFHFEIACFSKREMKTEIDGGMQRTCEFYLISGGITNCQ